MADQFQNPFQESRATIPVSTSLLSYGDDSFTFFSRLQNSRRLFRSQTVYLSQKEVQQNIINKLEKEMYSMDESGHCLAQTAIDQIITQDEEKEQDFWQKIKILKRDKQIQNPFSSKMEKSTVLKKNSLPQKTSNSRLYRSSVVEPPKTARQSARLEMIKMKDIIKKEKLKQAAVEEKVEKFSLINMYKVKRQKQPLIEPDQDVQSVKTETPTPPPRYPQFITLRNTIYLRVDLQS